ncbi:MAG: hypothetical protein H0V82_10615 [Candidatus Protochlamydia sp.]|nr:hypothetical protein [Candidatus Protochlamydia sp.]
MHIENVLYNLTPIEQFGFTPPVTHKMCEWNHSADNPLIGAMASRIVGFILIAFSELVDACAHLGIAFFKGVIGVFVSPYNSIALIFFPEKRFSADYELSSAFIHLWRVVECLFGAAIFPFICLLNPDAAFRCMGYRLPLQETLPREERNALTQEIASLNDRSAGLRLELAQANQNFERVQNTTRAVQGQDSDRAGILQEREDQIESLQTQLTHTNNELSSKEERVVLLQQELERAHANLSEMDQLGLKYTALHRDVEEDQDCISDLKTKLEATIKQKENFEEQFNAKETMIEELIRQIEANNETINNLTPKVASVDLDSIERNRQYENKIQELTEANHILNQNGQHLKQDSLRLKQEFQNLNERILREKQDLSTQINQLKCKLDEKQNIEKQLKLQLNEALEKSGALSENQKNQLEAAIKNFEEMSQKYANLKSSYDINHHQFQAFQKKEEENNQVFKKTIESLNDQIENLLIVQKKDEEEKKSLIAENESQRNQIIKKNIENEDIILSLEKKIEEMDAKIKWHLKIELEIEKLREKAALAEQLNVKNKILEPYCLSMEEELSRLRKENNDLRAGPNEDGNIIRSPSKNGF